MKKFTLSFKVLTLLMAGFFFLACSDDDEGGNMPDLEPNIAELAIATPELTNLVAALERANLVSTLQGDGPFTVFAPDNAAFEAFLTANNFSSLEAVPVDVLTQVLLNHVVAGEFASSTLSTNYYKSFSTAGPDDENLDLYISTSGGVSINGISSVTTADVMASNGVVHIVDEVIGLPTIVDHALANPELSELVGALTSGGNTTFTDLLSDTGEVFTVFAPINSAFSSFTNPNSNDLSNILSNHVLVGAAAYSAGLTNSYTTTAGTNDDDDPLSLYINTDDGVSLNGTSSVVIPDIVAVNGVIHAVDAVIDIPTVVTFATADPMFSTLVEALTTATPSTDFAGILSDQGPFTVFAPTNDAFAALLVSNPDWDTLEDIDEGLLTSVLQHHVTNGNVRSGDLTDGIMPATLEGDNITINLPGTDGNIADVTDGSGTTGIGIIAVDVQAGNGVIHVLNQVLIPDTTN